MNFMRDIFTNKNKARKLPVKDINFFQTVREGSRRYRSKAEKTINAGSTSRSYFTGNSGSSVVGRTYLRPIRKTVLIDSDSRKTESSVLNILSGEFNIQPSSISSKPSVEETHFFKDVLSSPPVKRIRSVSPSIWNLNEEQSNMDTFLHPGSSLERSTKNIQRRCPKNVGPIKTNLFIDETAKHECNQFRSNLDNMRANENLKSPRNESPSLECASSSKQIITDTPVRHNPTLEVDETPDQYQRSDPILFSSIRDTPDSNEPQFSVKRIGASPCIGISPLDQLSSATNNIINQQNTPSSSAAAQTGPTSSSNFNIKSSFFSDIASDAMRLDVNSGKNESFFKIPELPTSSVSDQYENLFTTPTRVKSLPRITTPQLFLPYSKTTPSVTTPQTKSSEKTPQSSAQDSFYVISITEGRGHAMCEVGIAAIDLNHPTLLLSQFSDSQTYKKALAKINVIDPAEMLVPDTFRGLTPSVLYKTVTETFPEMRVITVKRQHFSAKHGLETVRGLMLPDSSSVEMIILQKYYCLAASEALFKYIEIKHGILFAPKSLKVKFQSAKDVVSIDLETCQRLELVMANAEMIFPEKYSLFGLLNRTKTLGGRRRLRVSLLQPSSSVEVIRERQNSVAALVTNQKSLASLQTHLLKFSNVERLLWLCLKSPNFKNEAKTFETLTNYILLLKASLEAIPHLRKVLQEIDDDHIINIRDELSDDRYDMLLQHIQQMIHEDARPARGFAESEKQRCFAIKDGINDLLDVARATYSDLIQQVIDIICDLSREHSLPLKMVQTADYGFHPAYVLPKNSSFHQEDLPEIFTEVKLKNRTVHLLTEEIYTYNMRICRALQEIQLITNVVIYDLVESLRDEISFLYRLCDHISELDFLCCIAQVSSTPDFTKPIFTDETSLIGARHPILDHIRPMKPIPNNFTASAKTNFNIITGPNMGGKTVYVLTIPLIQIMAQIGCYVPADKAELRISHHIYVKKGNSDSMECKLSSFTKEIKELTYALSNVTDRSLIILDEICTGTLSDEGTAIAWGFCEEFLNRPAFTFLTTHYHYLTNLSKIYKNVTNYHMEAIERPSDNPDYAGLTFTFRLLPGVTKVTNYALRLMLSSGLPDSIKKNAIEIAEDLARKRAASLPLVVPETPKTAGMHSKVDKLEHFMNNLYGLSMTDNFTEEMIRTLQRMAIEEILSDGEKDDSALSKQRHDDESCVSNEDKSTPAEKTDSNQETNPIKSNNVPLVKVSAPSHSNDSIVRAPGNVKSIVNEDQLDVDGENFENKEEVASVVMSSSNSDLAPHKTSSTSASSSISLASLAKKSSHLEMSCIVKTTSSKISTSSNVSCEISDNKKGSLFKSPAPLSEGNDTKTHSKYFNKPVNDNVTKTPLRSSIPSTSELSNIDSALHYSPRDKNSSYSYFPKTSSVELKQPFQTEFNLEKSNYPGITSRAYSEPQIFVPSGTQENTYLSLPIWGSKDSIYSSQNNFASSIKNSPRTFTRSRTEPEISPVIKNKTNIHHTSTFIEPAEFPRNTPPAGIHCNRSPPIFTSPSISKSFQHPRSAKNILSTPRDNFINLTTPHRIGPIPDSASRIQHSPQCAPKSIRSIQFKASQDISYPQIRESPISTPKKTLNNVSSVSSSSAESSNCTPGTNISHGIHTASDLT